MIGDQKKQKDYHNQIDTRKLQERRDRLRVIFNKRACSSAEFFAADFGHWPAKGLTVETLPATPVRIKSIFNLAAAFRAGLVGTLNAQSAIKKMAPHSLSSRISNSFRLLQMHILDSCRTAWGCEKEKTSAYVIPNNPRREIFMHDFDKFPHGEDILSHEHIHIRQNDQALAGHPNAFENLHTQDLYDYLLEGGMEDEELVEIFDYLSDEAEIQARLHTIIVIAYQFTQNIPQNIQELSCLLYCCGVFPLKGREEKAMHKAIKEFERQGRPVFIPDPANKAFDPLIEAAGELHLIRDEFVRPARRKKFHSITLPAIYADLLTLYGDKKLAENIRAHLPRPC